MIDAIPVRTGRDGLSCVMKGWEVGRVAVCRPKNTSSAYTTRKEKSLPVFVEGAFIGREI